MATFTEGVINKEPSEASNISFQKCAVNFNGFRRSYLVKKETFLQWMNREVVFFLTRGT